MYMYMHMYMYMYMYMYIVSGQNHLMESFEHTYMYL